VVLFLTIRHVSVGEAFEAGAEAGLGAAGAADGAAELALVVDSR
jgi:hypothetical protein